MSQENTNNEIENKTEELSSDNPESTGLNKLPERDAKGRMLPGNTANPNGRPKGVGLNLTSLLKQKLEEIPEDGTEKYKDLFIKRLLKKALIDGDIKSLRLIINYVDGLPTQRVEGTINTVNIDYENLSDSQLKERISSYLERIGETGEEEGNS